jgi:uncharacterized protein
MQHSAPNSPKQTRHTTQNVDPRWLLKAIGAVLLVSLVCTYLTLWFLYYKGQWQIVLHPVRAASEPAPDLIRFAPDESGQPQLAGRLLVAPRGSRYSGLTILFLPDGDGSLADFASTLAALQGVGVNVFAFDYRGYGFSANIHPSQERMTQDAEAALGYLTLTHGLSLGQVIPYGVGVGASLAADLAARHREISCLILDSPHTDLLDVARRDSSALLPVGLLFRERFPLREPLTGLTSPKLLIVDGGSQTPPSFPTAADPKMIITLPSRTDPAFHESVVRFLDEYAVDKTVPTPAPSPTNQH